MLTRAAEFLFWLLVASVIGTIGGALVGGLLTAVASEFDLVTNRLSC